MPLHDYSMKVHSAQYSVHAPFHLKTFYCLKILETRRRFITTDFWLCFRIGH